jgi:holo-[acyl-carrier protein] synthase
MTIIGIGIDVVDLARFVQSLERTPGLLDRVLTNDEQHNATGGQLALESLAARFAVKEAVAKVLGAPAGLNFHDVQVSNGGAPTISLTDTVARRAQELGITNWHVSITHDGPVAIAYVIGEAR